MRLDEFDYTLPPELIAQTPIEPRDSARLLRINYHQRNCEISSHIFRDIPQWLGANDVLVFNNSRVMPARLTGWTLMGNGKRRAIECLLLRSLPGDTWEACVDPGDRLRPGRIMYFEHQGHTCEADILSITYAGRIVRFRDTQWRCVNPLAFGALPLPPYIHTPLADENRYQSIFAQHLGSVASSTASLHFTPELINKLKHRGVQIEEVTLHIGLGTFRPIDTQEIEDFKIHTEFAQLSEEVADRLNAAKRSGKRIIAVGTTVVRTLESFYDTSTRQLTSGQRETDLYICKPSDRHFVDALITNFHIPRSSLLVLVSSFIPLPDLKKAYQYALDREMRFLSFGDAMFLDLWRQDTSAETDEIL